MSARRKSFVLVPEATYDETTNSDEYHVPGCYRGATFYLDVSAKSGTTPTLDVKIQQKDPLTGAWTDLTGAAFAQKTDVGADALTIYPGIAVTANKAVSNVLPGIVRAVLTVGGTTPTFDCSVAVTLIP